MTSSSLTSSTVDYSVFFPGRCLTEQMNTIWSGAYDASSVMEKFRVVSWLHIKPSLVLWDFLQNLSQRWSGSVGEVWSETRHEWDFLKCLVFKSVKKIPFQRSWSQRTWSSRRGSSISPASLSPLKSASPPEVMADFPPLIWRQPRREGTRRRRARKDSKELKDIRRIRWDIF